MYTFGIDIGSTTSKCIVMKDGKEIVGQSLLTGGIGTKSPAEAVKLALEDARVSKEDLSATAATGYGRTRYEEADFQVSELTCHGLGAFYIFPGVRTIIDIGGQDAKVIALDDRGRMKNFLMNDKCAAGTGRFLDVMAGILDIPVGELESYAARAKEPARISSTCTVFAESEVISQLAGGIEIPDLVAGICQSVAGRVAALAKRINIVPEVCMSGGVAQNAGVRDSLSEKIGQPILFSPYAQLFGAIGAAIYAYDKVIKEKII